MTEMPQLVAALHSFVGLAAVFIGFNADIDAAMQAAGYRLGPFALIDLIGADINLRDGTADFASGGGGVSMSGPGERDEASEPVSWPIVL